MPVMQSDDRLGFGRRHWIETEALDNAPSQCRHAGTMGPLDAKFDMVQSRESACSPGMIGRGMLENVARNWSHTGSPQMQRWPNSILGLTVCSSLSSMPQCRL
jgi:hypothetical protein